MRFVVIGLFLLVVYGSSRGVYISRRVGVCSFHRVIAVAVQIFLSQHQRLQCAALACLHGELGAALFLHIDPRTLRHAIAGEAIPADAARRVWQQLETVTGDSALSGDVVNK